MTTSRPSPRPRGWPRPQRAHRDPVTPTAPRSATRLSARHLAALATRLTPRDLWLIAMLHEHRVLTTHAITAMAFTSDHRARRRLLQLHRWEVLERFAPRLPAGAAPMHYVLGPAGAAVLAAHHGLPARALGYRRDDALAIAHHHTLAHTVAVNDLFAHLIEHTLHTASGARADVGGAIRLDCWWSEARCRRHLDYVRPDAYGRLTTVDPHHPRIGTGSRVFEWFLELDFATSTLDALARKLDRYAQLAATTRPRPILIWLPTPAREAHARQRLAQALQGLGAGLLPIATSTAAIAALPRHRHTDSADATVGAGPADRVWLALTAAGRPGRLDLADLARLWPAQPGHTLADEAIPDDSLDAAEDPNLEAGGLPAPHPVPPAPSTAGHRRR